MLAEEPQLAESPEAISDAVQGYVEGLEAAESLTENDAVERVLRRVRLNTAIQLLDSDELSQDELVKIAGLLYELKITLEDLQDRGSVIFASDLPARLNIQGDIIFGEIAEHLKKERSGEERSSKIKLGGALKVETKQVLREAQETLEFISDSSSSDSETLAS